MPPNGNAQNLTRESLLPMKLSQQKYYKSYISQRVNEKKKNNYQDTIQNCFKWSWPGRDKQEMFVKRGQQRRGMSQFWAEAQKTFSFFLKKIYEIHFSALLCICTKISHNTSLLSSCVASRESEPFFPQEISPLRQCQLRSAVLLLPFFFFFFCNRDHQNKKSYMASPLAQTWSFTFRAQHEISACCTGGKIPNYLNRSSSLLIPLFRQLQDIICSWH